MKAILTPDDLKKGELVSEPGWYPAVIDKYEEKEAETDKSTNCVFYFSILEGKEKGKGGRALFNEKALGFGKDLWPIIGVPRTKDGGFECSSEAFKAAEGKKLKIYIVRGKSNKDNYFNEIKGYQPLA